MGGTYLRKMIHCPIWTNKCKEKTANAPNHVGQHEDGRQQSDEQFDVH
jgi:hypothetical protein